MVARARAAPRLPRTGSTSGASDSRLLPVLLGSALRGTSIVPDVTTMASADFYPITVLVAERRATGERWRLSSSIASE